MHTFLSTFLRSGALAGAALIACTPEHTDDFATGTGTGTETGTGAGTTAAPTTGATGETTVIDEPGEVTAQVSSAGTTTGEATTADVPPEASSTTFDDEEFFVLGNTSLECRAYASALPPQPGQLAAAVLTPPEYPFHVTAVRYELTGTDADPQCHNGLAHHALVFVADGDALPTTPSESGATFVDVAVPAEAATSFDRVVRRSFPEPIALTAGQRLVVAIELPATADGAACMRTCQDTALTGVDWWSAPAEPYAWSDAVELGGAANFIVHAVGQPG